MTISISETQKVQQPQDEELVLAVEGVSKKFCRSLKHSLFYGVQDIATDLVGLRNGDRRDLRNREFWALDNVSFELRRGEALGLVGKNGSGKSTLLRIIAGLIKPDKGTVRVKGKVAPLIALGAGFNPILTGRENIYANMSILGLSKQEIDDRFDDVVEFAEIGEAIDAPVQTYSSGMAARLGFASAIYTEPDILLIDEVLAVGDVKFQSKCARHLAKLRKNGTTFIFVSHQTHAIMSICETAIYLLNGKSITYGQTHLVIQKYEQDLFSKGDKSESGYKILKDKDCNLSSGIQIKYICFKNQKEEIVQQPTTGDAIQLCVGCKVNQEIERVSLSWTVKDIAEVNRDVMLLASNFDDYYYKLKPGNLELRINIECFCLKPGLYEARIYISEPPASHFDIVTGLRFNVLSPEKCGMDLSKNSFYQPHSWSVKENFSMTLENLIKL